jgi:hypothetical protein
VLRPQLTNNANRHELRCSVATTMQSPASSPPSRSPAADNTARAVFRQLN